MLADIGLTRSDVRDAFSEPLWRDPTDLLTARAAERRGHRGAVVRKTAICSPSLAPADDVVPPPTNRSARHAA
jgi:hypothetical protein